MGLRIRPYAPADENAATAVWSAASVFGHPFLAGEGMGERERLVREVYLVQAENWLGEDETGRIVGLLGLLDHDDAPCEVGGLFVHPNCHGHGHGRALLNHAVALKGALTLEVFELNRAAQEFYRHMGFEEAGRRVDESSGFVLLKMERPAAA